MFEFDLPDLHRMLPIIINSLGITLAIVSGYLLYSGLATSSEKIKSRIRFRQAFQKQKKHVIEILQSDELDELFKKAGHPLRLNAVRYQLCRYGVILTLVLYYIVLPILLGREFSLAVGLLIVALWVGSSPLFRYSGFGFIMSKMIEYKESKRKSEIFALYDLITSEVEMMERTRINTYNLIWYLKDYFKDIRGPLMRMLSTWQQDGIPDRAVDQFVEEMETKEAQALGIVLKTMDESDRNTVLQALHRLADSFVNAQVENYRRRRKLTVDIAQLPMDSAHIMIMLNVLAIVIYMAMFVMRDATL